MALQTNGRTNKRTDKWTDRRTNGRTDGRTGERIDKWIDGLTDEWIDRRANGRIDWRANGCTDGLIRVKRASSGAERKQMQGKQLGEEASQIERTIGKVVARCIIFFSFFFLSGPPSSSVIENFVIRYEISCSFLLSLKHFVSAWKGDTQVSI